jgi:hypothetical protein
LRKTLSALKRVNTGDPVGTNAALLSAAADLARTGASLTAAVAAFAQSEAAPADQQSFPG